MKIKKIRTEINYFDSFLPELVRQRQEIAEIQAQGQSTTPEICAILEKMNESRKEQKALQHRVFNKIDYEIFQRLAKNAILLAKEVKANISIETTKDFTGTIALTGGIMLLKEESNPALKDIMGSLVTLSKEMLLDTKIENGEIMFMLLFWFDFFDFGPENTSEH